MDENSDKSPVGMLTRHMARFFFLQNTQAHFHRIERDGAEHVFRSECGKQVDRSVLSGSLGEGPLGQACEL
jgi:hypothetical protein